MPTRNIAVHLIAMLCVALFSTAAHAQLRIGSWNTLDGPTSINDPDFVTVLTAIGNESVNGIAQPLDILILQEQAAATAGNIAATLNSI